MIQKSSKKLALFGLPVAIRQGRRHRRGQNLKALQIILTIHTNARIDLRPIDLRDPHLPEGLDGEMLEAADVDGTLLDRSQVAPAHAQVGRRAHLQTKFSSLTYIVWHLVSRDIL